MRERAAPAGESLFKNNHAADSVKHDDNSRLIRGIKFLFIWSFGARLLYMLMYIMLNYSCIVHVMASLAAWCKNMCASHAVNWVICCVMMQNCTALSVRAHQSYIIIFFMLTAYQHNMRSHNARHRAMSFHSFLFSRKNKNMLFARAMMRSDLEE